MTQLQASHSPEPLRETLPGAPAGHLVDTAASAVSAAHAEADAALAARKQAEAVTEYAQAALRERRLRLMRKIDAQPDFASMKESMVSIQKIARSDHAHARAMTDLLHDDTAKVGKLLRLINAAYCSSVGGGTIASLQRAVSLMGFKSVGLLASSLMLFERLPKGADGEQLRREFARAQFAALLAHDFCHSRSHIEDIYIAALFQRLGNMLAGLHFADEARIIEDQLDDQELAPDSPERQHARDGLARAQWGLTIDELGIEVAGQWGWPPALLVSMRALQPGDPELALAGDDYPRALCTAANRLAEELMRLPEVGTLEERAEARAVVLARFAAVQAIPLGLNPETLPEVVEKAKGVWDELLKALGIVLGEAVPAKTTAAPAKKLDPGSREHRLLLAENLADAVEQLRRMNRKGAATAEVMDSALRLMQKALALQRVIVCLPDAASGHLKGQLGIGDKAVVLARCFDIPLKPPTELLGLLCLKNADTLITDSAAPAIAQRLADWFKLRVRAGGFLVLPMVANGQVLGLLYGDQQEPGQMQLNERALTLLKNLRNQVLLAMLAASRKG